MVDIYTCKDLLPFVLSTFGIIPPTQVTIDDNNVHKNLYQLFAVCIEYCFNKDNAAVMVSIISLEEKYLYVHVREDLQE
jgi:hypothetical protein